MCIVGIHQEEQLDPELLEATLMNHPGANPSAFANNPMDFQRTEIQCYCPGGQDDG